MLGGKITVYMVILSLILGKVANRQLSRLWRASRIPIGPDEEKERVEAERIGNQPLSPKNFSKRFPLTKEKPTLVTRSKNFVDIKS